MELIKKLEPKKINGITYYFGIFLCPICGATVKKKLGNGKRDRSCGCARTKTKCYIIKNK